MLPWQDASNKDIRKTQGADVAYVDDKVPGSDPGQSIHKNKVA